MERKRADACKLKEAGAPVPLHVLDAQEKMALIYFCRRQQNIYTAAESVLSWKASTVPPLACNENEPPRRYRYVAHETTHRRQAPPRRPTSDDAFHQNFYVGVAPQHNVQHRVF